jgi:hypothetical protein
MSDAVLHYSDQTTAIKRAVEWLNHCFRYGLIYDTASSSNMGSLTTYAGLRANIALVVPPVAHRSVLDIARDAIGDNDLRPGELGRVAQILGTTFDTMIATASGQSAGSRFTNLTAALAAYTAPDTIDSTAEYAFHTQV